MSESAQSARPTVARHVVLWITVSFYMITYMDRVVISVAAPSIQEEYGFSDVTVGWIFAAFQLSYALFQIPVAWWGDRVGPRKALTAIILYWSFFTAATALAWNATSMIATRFLFGAGEAGAFPIATRSLSRWMLPHERAWAQGVTHAGARLAAALTPILVVAIIAAFGWRAAFYAFALVGVVWAMVWFWYYRDDPRDHRGVNSAELAKIEAALGRSPPRKKVPWGRIFTAPQVWLLSLMYFCYGYGIVTYLTWFPKYLTDGRGFSLGEMGLYASLPLAGGVVGNIVGGLVSDYLAKGGGNLKMARRLVAIPGFLLSAIMVPLAVTADNPMISILYFAIAVFGLETTVSVSWAIPLDIGKEFAGSVASVMNTSGNLAGALAAAATGYIVTHANWTVAFFVLAALSGLAALLYLLIDASKPLFKDAPA
jgi:MFS transporter, ACS family, glucarate transporter